MRHLTKDLGRLINGVSLVAGEIVRRFDAIEAASDGGVRSLMKKTVLSATDFTGLTRGEVREFSGANKSAETSIVYFNDVHQKNVECAQLSEQPASMESDGGVPIRIAIKETGQGKEASLYSECSRSSSMIADSSPNASGAEELGQCEFKDTLPVGNEFEGNRGEAIPMTRIRMPRERKVPSTPITRGLGFFTLGAGIAWGTVQESAKQLIFGRHNEEEKQSALSPFLSEKNAERLALGLCRMRGAALKLGQMLSIQDESLVPAPILAALEIVRQGADVMPRKQLNQVMAAELGSDWFTKLSSFNYEPIAAASIGQVHEAVTREGLHVAMKIQYPGVADSIESDIQNVKLLLQYTNLIPEGLYFDRAMKVAKEELSRECDYKLEASNQWRFRDLLSDVDGFYIPLVLDELSSKRVLTTELVPGIPIDKVALLDQETRNYVAKKLLELTLMELFVFRFMQTDPNWSNFLYDEEANSINLIDFGAARDYPKAFVDDYLRMVLACANRDRDAVIEMSQRLGFLTGMESEIMLDAHVNAAFVVGLPFSKLRGHDFRAVNITQSISDLGATMLKHRLTPPPDEAYSLHRKLSGTFLACMKLGAVVPCREMLLEVYERYKWR